jgi:hypothetical protein
MPEGGGGEEEGEEEGDGEERERVDAVNYLQLRCIAV